jgi:hypothetical protein
MVLEPISDFGNHRFVVGLPYAKARAELVRPKRLCDYLLLVTPGQMDAVSRSAVKICINPFATIR